MTPQSMSIMRQCFIAVLVVVDAAVLPGVAIAQGGEVWPKGTSVTKPQNTTGNTATFQVTKTSSGTHELVRFLCAASGAVSSCSPPAGQYMDSGQTINPNVTFATGLEGVGSVSLTAFGPFFGQDSGWVKVVVFAPAANTTYNLAYDGNGKLDRITDPAGRVLEATVSGGLLTTLKDPSLDSVVYGYDSEERLATRTNRRGHQTTYRYVNGLRVTSVEIPLSSATDLAVTSFTNWEERGLAIGIVGGTQTAQDPALVYTQVDGPRPSTDVSDVSRFWVDRWGAPTRIVHNALGAADTTDLTRGQPDVPALVTQVRAANGFITQATYDSRGNPLTTTAVNPYGPGSQNAVTNYTWDPTWDFVTKIKRPERDSVVLAYSTSNGNRLWQQDGRGDSTRVNFNYGNSYGLLSSTVLPGGARDSVLYSGALGNPYLTFTPLGFATTSRQDLMGRDTLITKYQERQRFVFDAMNRVLLQTTVGLEVPGVAAAESVLVQNSYNKEGNLDSLFRQSQPDVASIGRIKTWWVYDFAERRIKEVAPDGNRDSTVYDPASNVTTVVTRRVDTTGTPLSIGMAYDALNRLVRRVLPPVSYRPRPSQIAFPPQPDYPAYQIAAQTDTFTYDLLGRLLTADNADAKIKRSYYPVGLIETDSSWIQTAARDDWTRHRYGVRHTYDLDGRDTSLAIPQQLGATGLLASMSFAYDPQSGQLQSVTDLGGSRYTFGYNRRTELASLTYPGDYAETFAYDADGRLTTDTIRNTFDPTFPRLPALVRATAYRYDDRGGLLSSVDAIGSQDTLTLTYSGLGHLATSKLTQHGYLEYGGPDVRDVTAETYTLDALSNRKRAEVYDTLPPYNGQSQISSSRDTLFYQAGIGRDTIAGTTHFRYDAAGNVEFTFGPGEERATFYAADGTLRAADWRWSVDHDQPPPYAKYAFEEYRYDALGRRILVWSRKSCVNEGWATFWWEAIECKTSLLRRTVWNGNQELAEIQMPGGDSTYEIAAYENDTQTLQLPSLYTAKDTFPLDRNQYFGRVVYIPGRGIDQPIGVTRINYEYQHDDTIGAPIPWKVAGPITTMPFWTRNGDAPLGVFTDGSRSLCHPPTSPTDCVNVVWSYLWSAYDRRRGIFGENWFGTILESKRDKSTLSYHRNRYYDPQTGRFTQEDPIGLAGGLNLYGFAKGDPITFSDPFGLLADSMKKVSEGGKEFIKSFEKCVSTSYTDVGDNATIGCGHRIRGGEQFEQPMTDAAMDELFEKDIARVAQPGLNRITADLNQTQVDALGSFFFNAGPNRPGIINAVNGGNLQGAASMMMRFTTSGGVFAPGLLTRRLFETQMLLGHPYGAITTVNGNVTTYLIP